MTRVRRVGRPAGAAGAPGTRAEAPSPAARALAEVAAGHPVVLVDEEDGRLSGELVLAAEKATPELLAFVVRHSSGFVCVALPDADADRLDLPRMAPPADGRRGADLAVAVDAAADVTTGISARDRAHTIRLLADPATGPAQLRRPGHVVPLRARDGGVLERPGHAEAAVDLARLAGLRPAAVVCDLVNDDGSVAGREDLDSFCARHGVPAVRTADLVAHRRANERQVVARAEARLPTRHGVFRAVGLADLRSGAEHVALVVGDLTGGRDVPVRVHTECLTGDVFGSRRCACRDRLDASLAAVAAEGRGVVLYLRAGEPAGAGLLRALRGHQLQDAGAEPLDLAPARHAPPPRPGLARQALDALGVRSVRLLGDDPCTARDLTGSGIRVVAARQAPAPPAPVAGALAVAVEVAP